MISGTRLAAMIAFQRTVVQEEILKTAARLVDVDRRLNALRIEEALSWRRCATRRAAGDDASANGKVAAIFERRVEKADAFARKVAAAEAGLAGLEKRQAAAAADCEAARAALRDMERQAADEAEGCAAQADRRTADIRRHASMIAVWRTHARTSVPQVSSLIESSRPFAYLRRRGYGTPEQKGVWPWSRLDGWLADRIGYEGMAASLRSLQNYQSTAEGWQRQCDEAIQAAEREGERLKGEAMDAALGAPRNGLAACLNGLAEVENSMDRLSMERTEALAGLLDVALGRDGEYQTMVDTFIRLLSREKAAAMARLTAPGEPAAPPAEIDLIVRDRILLSMESDGLRRHLCGAEGRLKAVEDLQSRLSLRKWNTPSAAFDIDDRSMLCHDVATGRSSGADAWAEIEDSLGRRENRLSA